MELIPKSFILLQAQRCSKYQKQREKLRHIRSTFEDLNGETYTFRDAETFFGDISGRLGNGDTSDEPGH